MSLKSSVYIATSLDGFIARKDGDISWLDAWDDRIPEGEDCGYKALMDTVDVLVMGRHTFEKVLSFNIPWPYEGTPVVVLSSVMPEIPNDLVGKVSLSSEAPKALCERLSQEGVQHIYIDGGNTIQRFLAASLVDELTITIIPILLGEGIPLFGSTETDIQLRSLDAKSFDFGFVQLKYAVSR